MSAFKDEALGRLETFASELAGDASNAARAGAYDDASWLACASDALFRWMEEEMDDAIEAEAERRYEDAYRPE